MNDSAPYTEHRAGVHSHRGVAGTRASEGGSRKQCASWAFPRTGGSIRWRRSSAGSPACTLMTRRSKIVLRAVHASPSWRSRSRAASKRRSAATSCCIVVPLGAFVGAALFVLGLVNFENFVFTTIAIRASLDITKTGAGNGGTSGVNSATASAPGLDPTGALAILFILVAFFWLLTRMREGRKSPPMSIHRVCLILFALAGFLSVIDSASPSISLLEAIRVTAVVVDARRARGDARRPRDDQEVDRLDLRLGDRSRSATRCSTSSPTIRSSPAAASSRFEGTFSQPNPFAIYLTMLIVMGAALLAAPHAEEEDRHVGAARSFGRVPVLHVHPQRMDRHACRCVRGRIHGPAAHHARGHGRGRHGVACGVPHDPASASRTSARPPAPPDTHRTRCPGDSDYWGDVLPLANKDPITGIGLNMSSLRDEPAEGAAQRLPALLRRDRHHRDPRLPRAADQHGGGGPHAMRFTKPATVEL